MKTKRFLAWCITLAMFMALIPSFALGVSADPLPQAANPTALESSTKENTNQAGGIIYTKTSTAKSDGTVDITLTAHTTGTVKQTTSVTPTDIVLVLDVSGSMADNYTMTTITGYTPVTGNSYTYYEYVGFLDWDSFTGYGFNNANAYYINTGTAENPVYTQVSKAGRDANGYDMYSYSSGTETILVYPILNGTITPARANNYNAVQFYSATTESKSIHKLSELKSAVKSFIGVTEQMNAGLEKDQMHNISIVKFASNASVVANLTPVDDAGATTLESAVDALSANGATAVDYGLQRADEVFKGRTASEDVADRNEVVIVFADGEPNHQNGFDTTVANSALTLANAMKKDGVMVYTVCIADGANVADISSNINKFMHYLSSNFPDAESMTRPGTRAENSDYYKTPDSSHSLAMLFESIIQGINHPTITMGEEATMVDTISPYFDFQNGSATEVKLATSTKNADGTWAEPVVDTNLSYEIQDDRLTVNGFDFDANFVSETGRGENGDFYGRRLVVSFTVVPDYGVIDAASVRLMDGILPTNSGFASLNDSDSTPAAEVETPQLSTHKITYKVDGVETASYNRFTGTDITVDSVPTKTGYTFSGWTYPGSITVSGNQFTMPNEDVEIVGTFTVNTHTVKYEYSGVQPDGAPELPSTAPASFGSTVNVAPKAELTGYVFTGWYPLQADVTVSNGTFTMPDKDVTLVGYFEGSTTTPYKVEHYLETLTDGVYETTAVLTEDGFTGTTGHTVTATPLNRFTGFTYNEAKSAGTILGVIEADGSLVLKVYYDRNKYKVTYTYTGDIPQNPPAKPQDETYKYGENVTVADNVSAVGYTFTGWESQSTDKTAGENFEMPAHDVAFIGEFSANTDTLYKVEYYLQNIGNDAYTLDTGSSYENTATTGATVYANHKEFEGFVFDDTNADNKLSGIVAGDGSLVLKLYYNRVTYKITYAYEGDQPAGAPSVPTDNKEYKYGELVTVKPDLTFEGFTFAGWHTSGYTVDNDAVSFEMPARDVTLYGSFEPASGVEWKEEHYFESLIDDEYVLDDNYTINHTGTTGQSISAVPVADRPGFTYNEHLGNASGTVANDGSTVLKFYYERNSYDVSYIYDPAEQPTGAPALPSTVSYKYGKEVTIEGQLSLTGYDFIGWSPEQNIAVANNAFTMPAHNVVFEGDFNPRNDTKYEVHHHLMKADGTYPADPDFRNEHTGTTGATVPAIPRNFEGYELNASESQMRGVVKADGSLVLDLKYDRIKYKVTYAFEGDIPAGVTQPTGYTEHRHGAIVPVDPIPDSIPAGYTFVGWYRGTATNPVSGTFEMPTFDVHILGHFAKNTDTPYGVEHYLQNMDGSGYERDSRETRYGTTGEAVNALAKEYPGFVYNAAISTTSGEILGDGSFTLRFYYDRTKHKVTYTYEGKTPATAPAVPTEVTDVPYGKEMAVASAPTIPGYTFSGWNTQDATIDGGMFTMPARDVVLKGGFASNEVEYQVKYWHQNIADDEYTLAESYTARAYTAQYVQADRKVYTGFALNREKSNPQDYVTVDGDGNGNLVLNLFFDRHTFNVTYGYYGEQPTGAPDLSSKNQTQVRFGTVLTVENTPTLSGYAFDGWYTNTATVVNNQFIMPNHDVKFLGTFAKQFTVGYDLNGGQGAEGIDYDTKTVNVGTTITINEAPTRSGYTFKGWKADNATYNPGDTMAVDKDLLFVAQWSRNGSGGGGGITLKYTLSYESNGGTQIAAEKYTAGITVTINKTPKKEGHVFEGWYADEALTSPVDKVKMTQNITIYAKWVKDNGSAGSGYDTPESLNGEDHFAYVVGYPDGTVKPNAHITRAEVTAIFFRLLKPDEVRDKNLTTENAFTDVKQTDWYNTSISTMAKLGIVNGRAAELFAPDANITRAEFATICARFDDSEFEIVDTFTDVNGHWAESDIHEAAAHGWIRGYEDGTFKPDQLITRAEAMTMINRVLNRVPESANDLLADMITWPDNSDPSAWYYLAVQEATNSHTYDMKNHIYEKWTALKEGTDWMKYQ